MKHNGSMFLFQYWNRLRARRKAPKRTDIEPADIKAMLADTFILERDMRRAPIFRLAGTRLCATFGRELKGFSFHALWQEGDQRIVSRLVHSVFNLKSVVVIALTGTSRSGRTNRFELLVLPLDGGPDNPRVLGSIIPLDKPYWLGADPIVSCSIETLRIVDPELEPVFLKNRPEMSVPPLQPLAPRLTEPVGSGRRIRHLVVFQGGKNG